MYKLGYIIYGLAVVCTRFVFLLIFRQFNSTFRVRHFGFDISEKREGKGSPKEKWALGKEQKGEILLFSVDFVVVRYTQIFLHFCLVLRWCMRRFAFRYALSQCNTHILRLLFHFIFLFLFKKQFLEKVRQSSQIILHTYMQICTINATKKKWKKDVDAEMGMESPLSIIHFVQHKKIWKDFILYFCVQFIFQMKRYVIRKWKPYGEIVVLCGSDGISFVHITRAYNTTVIAVVTMHAYALAKLSWIRNAP